MEMLMAYKKKTNKSSKCGCKHGGKKRWWLREARTQTYTPRESGSPLALVRR